MIFYKLSMPEQERFGASKGKWFVRLKYDVTHCLVNDFSYQVLPVENTEEGNSKFYFDTAGDAFACSAAYYTSHSITYPYNSEWRQVVKDSGGISTSSNISTTNSQIMDFI